MVYRPTVRYADEFKEYVDELFHATDLDRNQIIRAALFSAVFSPVFVSILKQHKKNNVSLKAASWSLDQHWLWMEQNPSKHEGEKGCVNANIQRDGEDKREKRGKRNMNDKRGKRNKKERRGVKLLAESTKNQEQAVRNEQPIERREGKIPTEPIVFRNQGGISIKIG